MNATSPGGYVDFSRFGDMRTRSHTNQAAALHDVADEFEAMFIEIMLEAARPADRGDGLFDSSELDTYREMLDQQLALTMARSHDLGIGANIARQFGDALTADAAEAGDSPPRRASERVQSRETPFIGGLPVNWRRTPAPSRSEVASEEGADKRAFVSMLRPHATAAADALGLSPRALIAQAALESGWGRHVIRRADGSSSHNYFGIKAAPAWDGAIVRVPTTEYVSGRAVTVNAAFRAYPDAGAAFTDYVDFIAQNPRYRGVLAQGTNEAQFARQLEAAGYATDPNYANKIMAILSGDDWNGELEQSLEMSN